MVNAHILKRQQKANMIIVTCYKRFKDEAITEKGIELDVLVSHVCLEFGAGRRYVMEIIQDLENVKKIKIFEKKVYYVGE